MGIIAEGPFNQLIRGGLRSDFRDDYENWEEEYSQYLKKGTMDKPEMAATIMTGLSRMYERGDLEPVKFETPKIGPRVVGVDKEFGVGVAIGRKIAEDDQYGKIKSAAKWLANAARQTFDYKGASFLDDAFAGSTFKVIDGLALISASHTHINASGTWSNYVGTVGFGMTAMSSILDLFGLMKNEDGDPIKMMMDTLVIGNNVGDINTAMQILGNAKEPYTADNNDNIIKKRLGQIKLVISRYKVSSKSYFGIDSKWNDAELNIRRPVRVDDDFDFKTDAALFKATTRFMIWCPSPRGWVGGNPS